MTNDAWTGPAGPQYFVVYRHKGRDDQYWTYADGPTEAEARGRFGPPGLQIVELQLLGHGNAFGDVDAENRARELGATYVEHPHAR